MGCMLSMHKKPPTEVTPEQWNEEMHKKLYEFRADKLGEDVVRAECEEEKHRGRYHTTQKDLAPIMPLLPKTETPSLRYSAYRKSKLLENWVDNVTRVDSQIKIGEVNCSLQHSEAETDNNTNASCAAHLNCDNDNNKLYSSTHISSDDKLKMDCQDQLASTNVNIVDSGDSIHEQKSVKNLEDEEDSDCTSVNNNKCNSNKLSASPIDSNNNDNAKSDNVESKEERVINVENERKCTTDNINCTKTKKLDCVNGSRESTNNSKISSLNNNNNDNNDDNKCTSISNNNNVVNNNNSNNQNIIKTCNQHDMETLPKMEISHDTPVDGGTKASRATTAASLVIREVCSQANSIPLIASECEEHKEEHLQKNKIIVEKEENDMCKKTLQLATLYKVQEEMNINNTNSNSVTNLNSCTSNMLNELCHEECHKCKKVAMSEVAITNTTTSPTHTHKHDKHAFNNTLASPTSVHYNGNNQKTFVKEKHPRIVTDPPIVFLEPRWCKYSVDIKDPKNCYTIEHKPRRNQVTPNTAAETQDNLIVQNKCDLLQNGKQSADRNVKVSSDASKDNKDKRVSNSFNNNSNSMISQSQISKVGPLHSWYSESPSTDSICATIRNTKPESLKSILKRT